MKIPEDLKQMYEVATLALTTYEAKRLIERIGKTEEERDTLKREVESLQKQLDAANLGWV